MTRAHRMFEGNIKCTTCLLHVKAGGEGWALDALSLYQMEDGSYQGYCTKHRPDEDDETPREQVLRSSVIHFAWADVVSVTLHKLSETSYDRRGPICSIEMKEVKNDRWMRSAGIEVAQGLMAFAHNECTIRSLGEDGEQHHCWIFCDSWKSPSTIRVEHKYWGDREINQFRAACRLKAELCGWELIDETMSLLDRIVEAIDK